MPRATSGVPDSTASGSMCLHLAATLSLAYDTVTSDGMYKCDYIVDLAGERVNRYPNTRQRNDPGILAIRIMSAGEALLYNKHYRMNGSTCVRTVCW